MSLPDSYTVKPNSIPAYFDAILDGQPPERFSVKFFENIGFTSTNDRPFIGILKDMGFLNPDGVPQQRYYDFMDRSRSRQVVAEGVKDAFGELFAINTKAHELTVEDARNKLRTLYAGKKTDGVIDRIAKTFAALCDYGDFSSPTGSVGTGGKEAEEKEKRKTIEPQSKPERGIPGVVGAVALDSLQYHINIVLPESRDQAVYDAIFRSLREHLGRRHG